jgi:uncharacterized membrane protein YjjP (DUF1212 family)
MPLDCPDVDEIINIVRLCARIILENGGETYRAEETAYRICKKFGFDETEVFAIPTGVFIAVSRDGTNTNTVIKRIRKCSFNLQAIETVNSISRKLTAGNMSTSDALVQLHAIYKNTPRRKIISIFAAGLSSGCFALLFKGSVFDFFAATLCGIIVQLVASFIRTEDMFNFTISILGGFIIGIGSVLFVRLSGTGSLDKIITGAMMPLLPGIAMTNAIRDTMRGDLLSGVARGAEAILISAALAFGVGLVLKLYFQFFI